MMPGEMSALATMATVEITTALQTRASGRREKPAATRTSNSKPNRSECGLPVSAHSSANSICREKSVGLSTSTRVLNNGKNSRNSTTPMRETANTLRQCPERLGADGNWCHGLTARCTSTRLGDTDARQQARTSVASRRIQLRSRYIVHGYERTPTGGGYRAPEAGQIALKVNLGPPLNTTTGHRSPFVDAL